MKNDPLFFVEYPNVLKKMNQDYRLLVHSFYDFKIKNEDIPKWCNKIGKCLGFHQDYIQVVFKTNRKRAAAQCFPKPKLFFPKRATDAYCIIHELAHILNRDQDIHGIYFVEKLFKALDIIKNNAEELNIPLKTWEDVNEEYLNKMKKLARY